MSQEFSEFYEIVFLEMHANGTLKTVNPGYV
jgi:hypothetical protein